MSSDGSSTTPPSAGESTSIIRRTWDATADTYDGIWGHGLKTELETKAWSALLARLFPPDEPISIIDVGCGTGVVSLLLAELGHDVIGLDLSSEMLRVCQSAGDARGLTNLRLVVGDAECLPDGIGPVDAIISRHVLWTLPRPEAAVRSWAKLTKPGGRVASLDGLWSPEVADRYLRHYPSDIDMCLRCGVYAASIPPETCGDAPGWWTSWPKSCAGWTRSSKPTCLKTNG
ncbi:MAG: class I SAM-dependent methyltransferase [Pseudonocardiaceae bacterium]